MFLLDATSDFFFFRAFSFKFGDCPAILFRSFAKRFDCSQQFLLFNRAFASLCLGLFHDGLKLVQAAGFRLSAQASFVDPFLILGRTLTSCLFELSPPALLFFSAKTDFFNSLSFFGSAKLRLFLYARPRSPFAFQARVFFGAYPSRFLDLFLQFLLRSLQFICGTLLFRAELHHRFQLLFRTPAQRFDLRAQFILFRRPFPGF